MFIQNIIDFLIISFAIFIMIRTIDKFKKKEKEATPAPLPSEEIILLREIRDSLKNKDASK